ncbi:RagB/SusD family nutrient uptake outer membrane protein [Parabacteroides sp. 52]|uniref:RagB/SusD family nutrient uptake outer membrane protein n=1 Tax=unclassified Parabacteroides TaxID=2649774 RepID=UPI0013D7BE6D|nr:MULTISPECIES: RagB/SusD family nutrient uptake outer membrane protein [unclassified Parabacteroides]MDH6535156.1 hypothetical protein [Parabacteroides sp. PM5-20]NDV56196.1 RagB/SusD family nutrient uptake outer membrane protein [Parabacteroides sp. 52]
MRTIIYKKGILIAWVFCLLTACNSDFLNEVNPNQPTEDTYWNTEADAEAALATIYSPIRGQMYGYWGAFTGFQNQNVRGDDVHPIQDDPTTWQTTVFINDPNNSHLADDWGLLYKSISRANTFITNVDKVEMDITRKNEMLGEAYFLRAWNYFMLVMNWGDVPLRLTPIQNTDESMSPSTAEAEIWVQVEADLKQAKTLLPVTRPAAQNGRVTKGAAIAYLGRAYIYQNKFAEGKAELEEIMQSPYTYELVADYEDNYTEKNEFNEESIFEINYMQFGTGGVWGNDGSDTPQINILANFVGSPTTDGWYKIQPSKSIVDEFTAEERPAGADSRWDKRMYTNFFFKYSDYNDPRPDETWYGEKNISMDDLWTGTAGKRTGNEPGYSSIDGMPGRFIIKKFTAFWSSNGDGMYHSEKHTNNIRVMRFAEVLLLHAEAAAKTGNLTAANSSLTRIRDRAGLAQKSWASADEIMKEIEHQRLLEFWMEGHRFYDLKRWYTAAEIKNIWMQRGKLGANNFQEKHLYYPIPQGEINSNTEIEQHPLWR